MQSQPEQCPQNCGTYELGYKEGGSNVERGEKGEQNVPDVLSQKAMLRDALECRCAVNGWALSRGRVFIHS